MCGLVGYIGQKSVSDVLTQLLERLEYRGYDSAGIALNENGKLILEKSQGLLVNLCNKIENKHFSATSGIGHTRWATHGKPNERNAHPHISENGQIALVHNGIIENYNKLKNELKDVKFASETDTEVVVQLLGKYITKKSDENHILQQIARVCEMIKGSYAFAIMVAHIPNKIFFAKKGSPLIIGCGKGENFLASDIPALLPFTNNIIYVKDCEMGEISAEQIKIFDFKLKQKNNIIKKINLSPEQVMLGNYSTFMEKEIAQGSYAMQNTLEHIMKDRTFYKIKKTKFQDLSMMSSNIHIVACGTALHAGMLAKYVLEKECRVGVSLDYASEFRYKKPLISKKSICIFISQSGETADTIASLELAKKCGAYCVAITNVITSRISSLADFVIPTYAGPEIAVASTKAYVAQITALYALIEFVAKLNNKKIKYNSNDIFGVVKKVENWSAKLLWHDLIKDICTKESIYFVGRGVDFYLVKEGALKLTEISYIHAEAFAGGELKHGSLALINEEAIVIVLLTQKDLIDKTLNAIAEIKTRGATVILISQFEYLKNCAQHFILLPKVKDILMPFVAIKPLQELAFLCAKEKNLNPDKPRNLAKSVTVE